MFLDISMFLSLTLSLSLVFSAYINEVFCASVSSFYLLAWASDRAHPRRARARSISFSRERRARSTTDDGVRNVHGNNRSDENSSCFQKVLIFLG